MTVVLYVSIWLALVALLLGELGRHRGRQAMVTPDWAIGCSAIGAALGILHSLLALGIVYDWDHDRAVSVTAQRAAEIYGVAWSGSLYMNYVLLGWWLADTIWWRLSPLTFLRRPALIEWAWRFTVFTMVINGGVIFASRAGRVLGVVLAAALVFVWTRRRPGLHLSASGTAATRV